MAGQTRYSHVLVGGLLLISATVGAQTVALPGIVVTGPHVVSGTPASIDRIDVTDAPARAQASVSELLRRLPGIAAHDRQNLAQDVQLSIRGFGARSAFGVRGVRLLVDGIPATMPDGQGQVSHVPLGALSRVEVLRGPFSALYGNASGGVVAFFSADPPASPEWGVDAASGTDDVRRTDLDWAGPWPRADGGYRLDASRLYLGGWREHSRARRDIAQARMTLVTAAHTRVALTLNALDLGADDPQGLTSAQALQDPRAASAGALAFDTRKRVRQQQAGLLLEQPFGPHDTLMLSAHAGKRETFQMLSVPVAAQLNPASGGGVVDLDRDYSGLDLRWRHDGQLMGRAASLTSGLESQQSGERRLGYENFAGSILGVVGALRRNQRDTVAAHDAYLEARWQFAPRWRATLGVRHSRIDFRSRDVFIAPGNPDDSGTLRYTQTTPVAGVLFTPVAGVEVFANAGRGFETPSLAELAYRSDGRSGLNDVLRPARSNNIEIGTRVQRREHLWAVSAFSSRTRDELVVASNFGGRSSYANAARTQRRGWELSASGPLASHWRYAIAYTRLDARYSTDFSTCRAPPCTLPDTQIPAGNRLPATTPQSLWAELRWSPRADVEMFVDGNGVGRIYADDSNTAFAPGHATFDIGAERRWRIGRLGLKGYARIDNLFDRAVIGSVIVNDGNGRYFEPAPGRTLLVGLSVSGSEAGR